MTQPTEADIRAACEEADVPYGRMLSGAVDLFASKAILALARRIEAEREAVPVAWLCEDADKRWLTFHYGFPDADGPESNAPGTKVTFLYAHPPKEPNNA